MAVEVILLERIENLGQMGDVVKVRPGFARNYLLPKQKALRANKANRELFETQRAQLEAENLERRQEAEQVSGKIEGLQVTVIRQAGDNGQLYGSVNARDVAEAVTGGGATIGRGQVVLEKPIKTLGLHPVRIRLHPEVSVSVTVNVARSEAEAELQAKAGRFVSSDEQQAAEEAAEAELEAAALAAEEAEAAAEAEAATEAEDETA
ncbi:large subunit ribosomal protein L9 [Tistlia consotensis]|uniref:Large ribosomal subunit protein bL9 n=1 Tax=Tistlia consotensis USBA 355 TaxID=560819 RepID=A0A1Y6CMB0_9PROT|nr:50S ribosomal protein L9 [Tistlia consotensis]SMF76416.1 large subunit ribosomal protein L9 [Tistlia consotensis USBA 355]SNS12911.1 large subunit ribosomal protein L9 [Tistlia consotensis]